MERFNNKEMELQHATKNKEMEQATKIKEMELQQAISMERFNNKEMELQQATKIKEMELQQKETEKKLVLLELQQANATLGRLHARVVIEELELWNTSLKHSAKAGLNRKEFWTEFLRKQNSQLFQSMRKCDPSLTEEQTANHIAALYKATSETIHNYVYRQGHGLVLVNGFLSEVDRCLLQCLFRERGYDVEVQANQSVNEITKLV